MKNEASLIIIRNRHNGDTVIGNVLNYVLSSPFAELDEVMVNGLTLDYYKMVEEFYKVQKPYSELDSHRRLFHMVLSARHSKHIQRTLDEAAKYFLGYMTTKGHQVLLVPHYGSEDNAYNYHGHAVVNVKSYSTGQTLYGQYATYKEICGYLSKHQGVYWNYKYHTDKRVVAGQWGLSRKVCKFIYESWNSNVAHSWG